MICSAYDFRCHVAGRAACVLEVSLGHVAGYPEICDLWVSFVIEDQVLGFEVAMDNALGVQILEAENGTSQEKTRNLLWKGLLYAQVIAKVSSIAVISH